MSRYKLIPIINGRSFQKENNLNLKLFPDYTVSCPLIILAVNEKSITYSWWHCAVVHAARSSFVF
jgi:hypothetical protein